jgi:hypothetical protein
MRKFSIAVTVLIVLLVVADRVGVLIADFALEGVLKDRLDLERKPKVHVHGIPFLTQLFGGTYHNVEVEGKDLTAGDVHDLDADVHLHGAHVSFTRLFTWKIDAVPVDRADATVTMPYTELAALSGVDGLTVRPDGDKLAISAPLQIAGRTVRVSGTAHAEVTGTSLTVVPDSARAGGAAVPAELLRGLRYTIRVTELPFDLRLEKVNVTPDGLAGSATATNITIRSGDVRNVR